MNVPIMATIPEINFCNDFLTFIGRIRVMLAGAIAEPPNNHTIVLHPVDFFKKNVNSIKIYPNFGGYKWEFIANSRHLP